MNLPAGHVFARSGFNLQIIQRIPRRVTSLRGAADLNNYKQDSISDVAISLALFRSPEIVILL